MLKDVNISDKIENDLIHLHTLTNHFLVVYFLPKRKLP